MPCWGSRRAEGEGLTRTEAAGGVLPSPARLPSTAWWVLEVLALADGKSESVGESMSRALIHVLGLPAPVLQHTFYDNEGFIARTDFFLARAWRHRGVRWRCKVSRRLASRRKEHARSHSGREETGGQAPGARLHGRPLGLESRNQPRAAQRKLAAAGITAQKSPPRGLIPPALPGGPTT